MVIGAEVLPLKKPSPEYLAITEFEPLDNFDVVMLATPLALTVALPIDTPFE